MILIKCIFGRLVVCGFVLDNILNKFMLVFRCYYVLLLYVFREEKIYVEVGNGMR